MQSISSIMSDIHLILYLCCKFHGNIPNVCQDIANLLLGYFNLSHPAYQIHRGQTVYTNTPKSRRGAVNPVYILDILSKVSKQIAS